MRPYSSWLWTSFPWSVSASRCSRVPHSRLAKSRIASTKAFCSSVRVIVIESESPLSCGSACAQVLRFLSSKLGLWGLRVHPFARDAVPVATRRELPEHCKHLHLEPAAQQVLR